MNTGAPSVIQISSLSTVSLGSHHQPPLTAPDPVNHNGPDKASYNSTHDEMGDNGHSFTDGSRDKCNDKSTNTGKEKHFGVLLIHNIHSSEMVVSKEGITVG